MEIQFKAWSKAWTHQETDPGFRIWHFIVRIGTLVVLFMAISGVLQSSTRLLPESYQKPVIYFAFLEEILTNWQWLFLLAVFLVGAILFRKNLFCSWAMLSGSKFIRILVMIATVVLAWTFATYDFNLYFNQAHYTDRIFLLVLIPLIFWRPVFVLLFLTVLFPIIWQFSTLSGFFWGAILIPLNMLILFTAFFLFYVFAKIFLIKDFVFLTGCLFAANYWLSGYGKFNLDWLMHDQIYFLLPATYANGWLAGFNPNTISSIAQKLALFNVPLKLFIISIEFGMLLFFYNIKLTRLLIGGTIILHTGIFLVSGICFWMWLTMGVGLLISFSRVDAFRTFPLHSKMHVITSMILIASGVYWCDPARLAWYDSPVSYTYRFEAITENGQTYQLPPGFFEPYDFQFTIGNFRYMSQQPSLRISWGATTDAKMARELTKLNLSQIPAYEAAHGIVNYNVTKTSAFDNFLKEYIRNWNERLSKDTWLSKFQAPKQLWTYPKGPTFEMPQRIDRVAIIRVTSFFTDNQYLEIQKIPIREIKIPS